MDTAAGIFARESPYLDRSVQFGVAGERVISVSFPWEADDETGSAHDLLDRIDAYLQGERETFADVTVALTVPTDRRAVLETVGEIPHGDQASVEQLARMTPEDEGDAALIRETLADNPVPLLIPDHRVRDGPSGAPADVEQKLRAVEGL